MSSPSSSDPHPPRIVAGRYQIDRKIGSGGMGAVYLARQVNVGNQVAIKFLPAHLAEDAELRRRFEREAALTLQVTHPGAAQLLDTGQDDDGQLYLVFEFVEGDDLSTLLDRDGALAYNEAFAITLKVAEALAYAHHKGVVHRDIKPENIRVRRDLAGFHVKLLDFGIARLTDDAATRLTVEGGVAGTPRYMAPEQITGGTIDGRTDVYALGLVLFEMLTGRKAFVRSTPSQLMWAQMNEPVPPLRSVQPLRDHQALDAIIAKACAKQPGERFGSMREMIKALQKVPSPQWPAAQPMEGRRRSGAPVESTEEGFRTTVVLSRPGRTTLVHRRIAKVGLAVAAVAVIAAAAALWFAIGRGKDALPTKEALPTRNASPTAAVADAASGTTPSVAAPAATAAPLAPKAAPTAVGPRRGLVIINGEPLRPGVLSAIPQLAIAPATTAPAGAADCPSLRMYDPAITNLSVAQLEQRAREVRYITPSVALRQLETLRASAENYAPDMRECLYKASLVQSVLNERTVLQSTPGMWGHTKDVNELERLFMEQPLRDDWSAAQRRSVLDQIDKLFIANLAKEAPGDETYWRRMYYGIEFSCEASDAALAGRLERRRYRRQVSGHQHGRRPRADRDAQHESRRPRRH